MNEVPRFPYLRRAFRAGGLAVGTAVLAALVWCGGFLWFVTNLPDRVIDYATHTDAIVVLTGGSERLSTGIGLLERGLADKLFISGVHRGVEVSEILKLARTEQPELAGAIVLGHAADDTIGNAAETAAWVRKENIASLRLVTGAYHMPRSLAEFRHALPDVAIVPHPVFPDTVKSQEWWRWPGTAALLATEYSKYVAAEIRQTLLPRKPPSP
jgi:uncharacterized SAM-binding protein YcdF (DUF218 family)